MNKQLFLLGLYFVAAHGSRGWPPGSARPDGAKRHIQKACLDAKFREGGAHGTAIIPCQADDKG